MLRAHALTVRQLYAEAVLSQRKQRGVSGHCRRLASGIAFLTASIRARSPTMPTYEYTCPEGHDFEQFVRKISDARSELPCPVCGRMAARRMSAGAGLIFKGSGFYITDYGKDGKKDAGGARARASAGEGGTPAESGSGGSEGGAAASANAGKGAGDTGTTPGRSEAAGSSPGGQADSGAGARGTPAGDAPVSGTPGAAGKPGSGTSAPRPPRGGSGSA